MARPGFADMLDRSNQELIDNLNSRRYIPPPVQMPVDNPLYQNVMGAQGYDDPYALERMAAQSRAAQVYSEAMASQTQKEALHTGIGTALMAIPYAGIPLSFAYKPFAKAMGWLDPEEIYSQADYTKAGMAEAITGSMMGQMGQSFIGGNLSMQQANSLSDDIYGSMRQRGFQGLELGRMMPMLGESGLLTPTGRFADADEALTQFQDRLEGFLDKVANTVRSTSIDIESATALAISESMLAGSRGAVAGGDYLESARMMSNMTGMSIQGSELAMRQSMGAWGSTVYDRRNLATASVFDVASATTAASQGGRWDAAWMNVDADQFGLRVAGWGNQYWMDNKNDLARLWSAEAMPGGDAWGAMVAGEGMPDTMGTYKDIGDINARLEAQYYGMQVAAENPSQMTTAAMGMMINKMEDKGVYSREARIMHMMGQGWDQSEAATFLDMYDQMSTPLGRAETYFRSRNEILSTQAEGLRTGFTDILSVAGQVSQERNAFRAYGLTSMMFQAGYEGGNINTAVVGMMQAQGGYDPDAMLRGTSGNELNLSALQAGYAGVLAGQGGLSRAEANRAATGFMFGESDDLSDAQKMRILEGTYVNIPGGANISIANKIKGSENINREYATDRSMLEEFERQGGFEGAELFGGMSFTDLLNNPIAGLTVHADERGLDWWGESAATSAQAYVVGEYEQRTLGSNVTRMLTSRYAGGEARTEALTLAAEGGYLRNVNAMIGTNAYRTAAAQADAIMYLGDVNESTQGYRFDPAHRESFQNFRDTLEKKGFTFTDAIAGVNSGSLDGQIEVRDSYAQAGFDKSYAMLNQTQRDYIEEMLHANDYTGDPGNREWAGRHDALAEGGWDTLQGTLMGVSFGGVRGTRSQLEQAASEAAVEVSQIESYALWAAAQTEGAGQRRLDELAADISDMEKAEAGFQTYQELTGLGFRDAAGNLIASPYQAAIASAGGRNLTAGQERAVWAAFRETGDLSGLDPNIARALEGDLGKWATDDSFTTSDFLESQGVDLPWGISDENNRKLTTIPEFQGSINAVITPAGGAMPVVQVESLTGTLGLSIKQAVESLYTETIQQES